jgi:type I restriction enzyme S subunit
MPKDWETTSLGDICTFISGGTPSKENKYYWSGEFPWVSAKDLKQLVIKNAELKLSEEGIKSGVRLAPQGSVLVLVRGMALLKDLPIGYADRSLAFNQDIKALVPHTSISGLFLAYTLIAHKKRILKLVDRAGHGTGRLDTDRLKEFTIDYPINPEDQENILRILTTWDHVIDLTTQLIAAKQQRKRGLMQQLLTGKKRFPNFQTQPWLEASFGQVFQAKSIRNTGSLIQNPITVGKYAIRPQNEHFNRIVASNNLENYNIIEKGDFVYDPMSAYYGAFGRYEMDEPGIVSPVYRVLQINSGYDSDFIKHFVKSHYIAYQLSANSSQGNREGKRRTIQSEAFDSIRFKIPQIDEQQAIARVLNACDNELVLLERKLALLKKQKQGLMQQLLTGKIRVKI